MALWKVVIQKKGGTEMSKQQEIVKLVLNSPALLAGTTGEIVQVQPLVGRVAILAP